MYSSLKVGHLRAKLDQYLNHYYKEYQNTLKKSNIQEVPFTLDELKVEQREKVPYGSVVGMALLPMVFAGEEEAIDFTSANDENYDEMLREWNEKNIAMMLRKPDHKAKFLSIFDDLRDYGFISDH